MADSFSLTQFFEGRTDARREFVDRHEFKGAVIAPLYEDMASRRFYRLHKEDRSVVLMDSLPDTHPHATLGHRLHDYIRLAKAFREQNIHAPYVYAADEAQGFLLMEDLGDAPMDEAHFDKAVRTLTYFREGFIDNAIGVPDYFASHIHKGHRRVIDWYAPCARRAKNDDGLVEAYLAVWEQITAQLPPPLLGVVHADYHRGNLRLTNGVCGVLDFQGAQWGPLAYDLVNLLEDAREVTPEPLKARLKHQYTDGLSPAAREDFELWYAVMAAQFHCRVAGQFIKLAIAGGKPRYLTYLPLVQAYLRNDLEHPILQPLKAWFAAQHIDFADPIIPDPGHIRADAF